MTWWMDYFVLRQAAHDFNPNKIFAAIAKIGCTVSEIDNDFAYFGRTFCIFEVWSTVAANGNLFMKVNYDSNGVKYWMNAKPVRSSEATTRNPEDKQRIDELISNTVGFEAVNKITDAMLEGGRRVDLALKG